MTNEQKLKKIQQVLLSANKDLLEGEFDEEIKLLDELIESSKKLSELFKKTKYALEELVAQNDFGMSKIKHDHFSMRNARAAIAEMKKFNE